MTSTVTYVWAPRLLHDLAVSRGDGSYGRLLAKLAKLDLLAIDDWLLAPLADADRRDLLEVLASGWSAPAVAAGTLPAPEISTRSSTNDSRGPLGLERHPGVARRG